MPRKTNVIATTTTPKRMLPTPTNQTTALAGGASKARIAKLHNTTFAIFSLVFISPSVLQLLCFKISTPGDKSVAASAPKRPGHKDKFVLPDRDEDAMLLIAVFGFAKMFCTEKRIVSSALNLSATP